MKPTLQLKLSQHLTLTPQLQQSIRLLQLSTLELNAEVERLLQENPLLEKADEEETGAPPPELIAPVLLTTTATPSKQDEPLDGAAPGSACVRTPGAGSSRIRSPDARSGTARSWSARPSSRTSSLAGPSKPLTLRR